MGYHIITRTGIRFPFLPAALDGNFQTFRYEHGALSPDAEVHTAHDSPPDLGIGRSPVYGYEVIHNVPGLLLICLGAVRMQEKTNYPFSTFVLSYVALMTYSVAMQQPGGSLSTYLGR